MASPAAIAERVQFGYAKAGSKLGLPHSLYRPVGAGPALAAQNLLNPNVPFIASATPDAAFKRPSGWTTPELYALVDPRLLQSGDYLSGPTGVWFVGSCDGVAIPLVVQCNYTVDISRPAGMTAGLNQAYGGRIDATDSPLVTGWPASLLSGGHSEAGRAMVPGDPKRFAGAICKLPRVPGVTFASGDRIVVEGGDTWVIAGAFLLDLGWRLELAGAEA